MRERESDCSGLRKVKEGTDRTTQQQHIAVHSPSVYKAISYPLSHQLLKGNTHEHYGSLWLQTRNRRSVMNAVVCHPHASPFCQLWEVLGAEPLAGDCLSLRGSASLRFHAFLGPLLWFCVTPQGYPSSRTPWGSAGNPVATAKEFNNGVLLYVLLWILRFSTW